MRKQTIFILRNKPDHMDYWLKYYIDKELYKRKISINVRMICSTKPASNYRKFGRLGWICVQILQLNLAIQGLRNCKQKDIILTESYPTGRLCAMISAICHLDINIIALNCLQQRTKGGLMILDKFVDHFAWKGNSFFTSVNARSAIERLTIPNSVKASGKIFVLPDMYRTKEYEVLDKKYDYMTGGYANRDYKIFFDAAAKMPQNNFLCIAGSNFKESKYEIPANVEVLIDVSEEEFKEKMEQSKVIIVPLQDERVAGLVLLQNAIAYHLPVIATDTEAVRNYIPQNYYEMLLFPIGNREALIDKMQKIYICSENWEDNANEIEKCALRWNPQCETEIIVNVMQKEKMLEGN